MAQFVFQLEAVVRQRKLIEEQRQRELAAVQAEMAALESQLRALDQEAQAATADVRENRLTGRLDLGFLAAHRRYTLAMQRKALGLAQQMASVQRRVDEARAALAEAAKKRKILEKLRERRYAQWAEDLNRKEMAQLDEVATRIGYQNLKDLAGRAADDPVGPANEPPTDAGAPVRGTTL